MLDTAELRLQGVQNLLRTLKAAEADLDELKEAGATAGRIVLEYAMGNAPIRSGDLAGSGRVRARRRGAVVTFGNATVPYAAPIHWGWPRRNIAANPFASEAAQLTEPIWIQAYRAELQKIANKVEGV